MLHFGGAIGGNGARQRLERVVLGNLARLDADITEARAPPDIERPGAPVSGAVWVAASLGAIARRLVHRRQGPSKNAATATGGQSASKRNNTNLLNDSQSGLQPICALSRTAGRGCWRSGAPAPQSSTASGTPLHRQQHNTETVR